MRINKYLAGCGVGSRRFCDKLVSDGKVKINGKTVTEMGVDVDENNDSVTVDNRRVAYKRREYYIMLHKPKGYVSTVKDDLGRKTIMDLIDINARLFPVGRLDYDTEGLLLLTSDGEVAQKLMHPSGEITKTYVARVEGDITEAEMQQLRKGILLDGKMTYSAGVRLLEKDDKISRIEIVIKEGRNRQVRRMLESIGKSVQFLKRTAEGELRLGGLTRGTYRFLNDKEIGYLLSL
mgnify:CR=1 FL=1